MARCLFLAVVSLLVCGRAIQGAAPPTPQVDPLKGVVTSGHLLSCPVSGFVEVWATPLAQDAPVAQVELCNADKDPARWQVAHGAFWVLSLSGYNEWMRRLNLDDPAERYTYARHVSFDEWVTRAELRELLRGK